MDSFQLILILISVGLTISINHNIQNDPKIQGTVINFTCSIIKSLGRDYVWIASFLESSSNRRNNRSVYLVAITALLVGSLAGCGEYLISFSVLVCSSVFLRLIVNLKFDGIMVCLFPIIIMLLTLSPYIQELTYGQASFLNVAVATILFFLNDGIFKLLTCFVYKVPMKHCNDFFFSVRRATVLSKKK